MRVRHKVPAIFSLSMVDMLCCALGCVILVWLLNAKQAEDESTERREEIDKVMRQAQVEREESQRLLREARSEHDRATARVRDLTLERDKAQTDLADLKNRLLSLEKSSLQLQEQLSREQLQKKDLQQSLSRSEKKVTALQEDLRLGSTRLEQERKKVTDLEKQLAQSDTLLKSARSEVKKRESTLQAWQTELANAQTSLRTEKDRVDSLTKKIRTLEQAKVDSETLLRELRQEKDRVESSLHTKEKNLQQALDREKTLLKLVQDRQAAVDAANARLVRAEKEKQTLTSSLEARFAGIELTGRQVLFVVDSSGSMDWLDENTESPQKWQEVCQTIARLMRSLPRLEKYQLLTFASNATFPMGNEGRWLDYDVKTSPEQVLKILSAIKPSGGTNMYRALEAAFDYRKSGLDTIYLFSDGLPTQGEGLTPTQNKTLKGIDRGVTLGKHVRTTLKYNWNRPLPNQAKVKIHTIGFFYESPDLGSFLWALARENEGNFVGMSRP